MTRSRKRKLKRTQPRQSWIPLASGIASALLAGSQAHAQAPAASQATGGLEEVVVTAQKRSEDLQKVPISLQVLGGEKLEQLQVTSFDDYAKFLPSVSYVSGGPGQAELYFRGISVGSNGLHAGSAPATGLYVDETPVTTISNSLDLHVYDVQRVEALAGPQGTLYGASSLSGTLRVITNKPDKSGFYGGYDIKADKYTHGDPGGQFEGFLNVPLNDQAAVRLVGYYSREGGYISNERASRTYLLTPADPTVPAPAPLTVTNYQAPHDFARSNFNDVETAGGRVALKYDINDRWTITPSLIYQQANSNGAFLYDPKIGDLKVTDFTPDYTADHWYQSALTVEGKISNWDFVYSGGYFERHTTIATDYSEYSVAYDYNGYSRFRDNNGNLIDPTQGQLQIDRYTKLTNEVRLSSPATDTLHYTVGAFYQRQTDTIRDEYILNGVGDTPAYNYSVQGQPGVLYLSQQDRVDRDYAIFGDATWNVTDAFKVSAGIRGFRADNTLYGFFGFNNTYVNTSNGDNFAHGSGTSGCTPPLTGSQPVVYGDNRPCVNTNAVVTENGETHRINATYQIDPKRMVYATYSTGFRPGGPNRRTGLQPYNSDKLSNYEAGWKTTWLDNTVRFNGAIFYERWNGVQTTIPGPNGINDLFNIGNAKSQGVEMDINWLAFDGLTLSASGSYVDAKTTTPFCGETPDHSGVLATCDNPTTPTGSRLPITPKVKFNAVARYQFNVGDVRAYAQAAALHQGSSVSNIQQKFAVLTGDVPAYTSADLSVGGTWQNFTASLFINNAFDERGEISRSAQCGNSYCFGNYRIYPIKPRMIGLTFGQKF